MPPRKRRGFLRHLFYAACKFFKNIHTNKRSVIDIFLKIHITRTMSIVINNIMCKFEGALIILKACLVKKTCTFLRISFIYWPNQACLIGKPNCTHPRIRPKYASTLSACAFSPSTLLWFWPRYVPMLLSKRRLCSLETQPGEGCV